MTLPPQRELFEIPDEVAYLNCAYLSPQPRAVREAGERAISRSSRPWQITPAHFFEEPEEARSLFAELVGGDADGVAIIPSASYGIAVAARNLKAERGQSIVVLEEQFPSNVYPWRELAESTGARLVTVPRPSDLDWTSVVMEHVGGDTAILAVPNCHWTDGSLLDVIRLGQRAREVGAALVVDATQSLGAYPLDVAEVQPDFLVSAAYKWLLGPYNIGFLYAAPHRREGEPIEHNWISRAGSEDFARVAEYRDDFQPGARRYDMGERSNFVLLPMANEALRQIIDWSVSEIAQTIGALTGLVEELAKEAGFEAPPASRRCPHMIGLRLTSDAPADLAARLAARNVFVSVRGNSLRVSPHVYNDERDVERLFAALESEL